MKGQIIPMNREEVIDDEIIRLVNANHERFVKARREQQEREQQEREEAERQAKVERRCYIDNQVLDCLICAVAGAGVVAGILVLML